VLLLLAAALLKPALGASHASDTLSVKLPQPVSSLESDALAARESVRDRKRSRASLSTSFFNRPDLSFSDSFTRRESFSATALPSLELALEQPKLWKVGDGFLGPGASVGVSSWKAHSSESQYLFETPVELFLRSQLDLTRSVHLFSRLGIKGSLYWTDYSTEFSSFHGWGRGLEMSAGIEVPYKESTASLSGMILRETRGHNSTKNFGMRVGWGITL
jgi:hypothetical protein